MIFWSRAGSRQTTAPIVPSQPGGTRHWAGWHIAKWTLAKVKHMIRPLTQELLKDAINYDPSTGVWTWRHRADVPNGWNTKHAGKIAGRINPVVGYLQIRVHGMLYQAHRLAFLYMTGKWPPFEVDHKDLARANCRWSNLRLATPAQNRANKKAPANNTSGFKGVVVRKQTGNFRAQLGSGGRRFSKEGFKTAEEAHQHYMHLSAVHHGEFGNG